MQLPLRERAAALEALLAMPQYLRDSFAALDADAARAPGADGTFSAVEQVWHLADLEREGFGTRIHRLMTEREPRLPDFDGARIAEERDYRSKSLSDGLAAFATARADNVALLRSLDDAAWTARGMQEGVGEIALCDVPMLMAAHDVSHRAEIEAWKSARS